MFRLYKQGLVGASSSRTDRACNTHACGAGAPLIQSLWENYEEDYIMCDIGEFEGCQPGTLCPRCVDELWNVWEEGAKLLKSACSQEQDEDHSFGSFLNVTVYTWNAAGLFCNDIFKMKAKLDYVGSWLCKGTVIAFQETHDDGDAATHNFESLYSNTFIFVRSALTRAAGGVMLAIKKSYVDRFCSKEEYVLIDGRMVAITLRHSHFNVCFICVHLQATPNDPDHKILMLKTLLDFVRGVADCYVFICGDFIFITDSCDRTDLTTGMSVGRLCKVGKFWNEHFYSFDELHQQSHTRFPTEAIDAGSSARLDRIYCNAPLEAFALWDVHVSTLGILHNAYISDHIPVVARIGLRETPRPCPNIPHFVTREAVFNNEVDRLMDKHSFAKCCWARVAETKEIFIPLSTIIRTIKGAGGRCLRKNVSFMRLRHFARMRP